MTDTEYWCGRAMPVTFDRKGFVDAYKEAFAGPPYFETYTSEQASEVFDLNDRDGLVMYATKGGKLIGFGCALPFNKSPKRIQEFLRDLDSRGDIPAEFDYEKSWYMSELGVLNAFRGVGAAWELILQRMTSMMHMGGAQYFMRTAAIGSNSAPMYHKCGAQPLMRLQDVSETEEANENQTQSDHRIFLWGNMQEAAAKIRTIKAEKGYPPFESPDPLD